MTAPIIVTVTVTDSAGRVGTGDVLVGSTGTGGLPGTWPHAPAWSTLSAYGFPTVIPTGGGVPIGDGSNWNIAQSAGPPILVTRESDLTAPGSPPFIARFSYPIGFPGGIGPGNLYYTNPGAPPSKLYVGFWWKPSNPWQGHSSNVNKLLFIYLGATTGTNILVMEMKGIGAGPFDTRIVHVGNEDFSYTENIASSSPLALGVWHQIEILVNEPAGALNWWIDGVLRGSYTGHTYPAPFASQLLEFAPTWGGIGDVKTENDTFDYDDVLVMAP